MKLRDTLLWPLSVPYEAVARLHAGAYRSGFFPQRKLHAFVISVGNLTVGGTGKTPMVLWIAQRLLAEGKRVGILTRGYRGQPFSANTQNPLGDSHSDNTSDEVQLLRSRLGDTVAFGVGPDRFARGSELAARGVEYFVLDDGFQHRRLARDVDVVLIDATDPFGGGHLLPAGRLREPRSALARAGVLVITRAERSPAIEAAIRQDSNAPIFYANPHLDSVHLASGDSPADLASLRKQELFAFCGIGNPPAFLADLRRWGFQVVGHKFFRDHHRYSQADALAIESGARNLGAAALICTEKDIFNLQAVRWHSLPLYFCRISLQIARAGDFWLTISNRLLARPSD
jgi:tetraacyldisaccharide 4'-kinase